MRQARERARVWPAPIALGVLTAVGLIAALLSERLGDWIAWLTITIPIGIVLWFSVPRRASVRVETEDRES